MTQYESQGASGGRRREEITIIKMFFNELGSAIVHIHYHRLIFIFCD